MIAVSDEKLGLERGLLAMYTMGNSGNVVLTALRRLLTHFSMFVSPIRLICVQVFLISVLLH